jgi:hypothetical protein
MFLSIQTEGAKGSFNRLTAPNNIPGYVTTFSEAYAI